MIVEDVLVCKFPFVTLRSEPNDSSEQTSQILAGEIIQLLSLCDGNWIKVRCIHDNYVGYADPRHFIKFNDSGNTNNILSVNTQVLLIDSGINIILPAGSRVESHDEGFSFAGQKFEIYCEQESTAHTLHDITTPHQTLLSAAEMYLNVPYLWGGRTFAGIDCSGLSQIASIVTSHLSCVLPRDASCQSKMGACVEWDKRKTDDLAFFEKDGKITHVAILIDQSRVIHASGSVRIDGLSSEGITHSSSGQLTHKLKYLKRLS